MSVRCLLRGLLAAGVAASSLLVVARADAADRVIATLPAVAYPGQLSPVEFYGGNLAWGVSSPGGGGFDYFVRDARGTRRLLAGRTPFELDLGARRGGGTQAVFSGPPRNGSNLVSYDFRSGATRRLSSLTRPHGFEESPSVWKGRYAFVRINEFDDPAPPPPTRAGLFVTSPLRVVAGANTLATDLRGSRLAYVTGRNRITTVYVATLRRGHTRVGSCFIARATNSAGSGYRVSLSTPVLAGGYVYWLREDMRANSATIRRRALPGRGCRSRGRERPSRAVSGMKSFAVGPSRFFYTTQTQVREATDPPLTFTR